MDVADKWPQPLLLVASLKPGETRTFELATHRREWDKFSAHAAVEFLPSAKSGRNILYVERLPQAEPPILIWPQDGSCDLGDGLTLDWESDHPALSFRTTHEAALRTIEVAVTYCVFGFGSGGQHILGFRVVVQAE